MIRGHVKSSTSPKKGNYCQRGEGGFEAVSYFLTSLGDVERIYFQLNGEFPFRGGGGSGEKRQEFPFSETLNF